ncbi:hypothetical protein PG989_000574 [Apiospora arundinis]
MASMDGTWVPYLESISSFNESWILLGLGLSVIAARTGLRVAVEGFRKLAADDYLMLIAALLYIAEVLLAYSIIAWWLGFANNGLDDESRAKYAQDPEPGADAGNLTASGGSKAQIACQNTYTAMLWTLKTAVCSFYYRFMRELAGYRYRIKIAFGVIFISWFTVHMTLLAGCRPFYKYWQFYPDPGNFCQAAVSRVFILTSFTLDALTDVYLLSFPLPMLWQGALPRSKKMQLSVVFSGAIFVMVAAFLRCYFIMTDSKDGASQSGKWACRETFIAVVTSNVPVIWSSCGILLKRRGRLVLNSPSRPREGTENTDDSNNHKAPKSNDASASTGSDTRRSQMARDDKGLGE